MVAESQVLFLLKVCELSLLVKEKRGKVGISSHLLCLATASRTHMYIEVHEGTG